MNVYYGSHKTEFPVHGENADYFFSYERVGDEYLCFKLEKDKCYVVSEDLYYCWKCGRKRGSKPYGKADQCKFCLPEKIIAEPNLAIEIRKNEKEYATGFYRGKKKFDYTLYYKQDQIASGYSCDRCKIIMWHHLNYCYSCGGKFIKLTCTNQELKDNYQDYKLGY